jgi:hypothetical protein
MKKSTFITGVAALFLSLASGLQAKKGEALPDHNVSEVKLGTHVSGPELKEADLTGKVVALVYWGIK